MVFAYGNFYYVVSVDEHSETSLTKIKKNFLYSYSLVFSILWQDLENVRFEQVSLCKFRSIVKLHFKVCCYLLFAALQLFEPFWVLYFCLVCRLFDGGSLKRNLSANANKYICGSPLAFRCSNCIIYIYINIYI